MKQILVFLTAAALTAACSAPVEETYRFSSPDGKLQASFILTDGVPRYSLTREGSCVVLPSRLGFDVRGNVKAEKIEYTRKGVRKVDADPSYLLDRDFEVVTTSRDSLDETWTTVWGEESEIRNHYNEFLVELRQKQSGRLMNIRFRLFDDGLGFRYEFPDDQPLVYFVLNEELTEFNMAADNESWWIPGDYDTQEYEYNHTRLSEIKTHFTDKMRGNSSQTVFDTQGVQTAFLMKTPEGLYVTIHEAALVDYPCMHLLVDGKTNGIRSFLTPDAEGYKGNLQTPANTPWRTVQVTGSATEMLASRLVLNLNEPCALDDVSWIHPVKYMGVWWEMICGAGEWSYTRDFKSVKLGQTDFASAKPHGRHGANNGHVREAIDFAADHGFDALLVEGWNIGWEDWANNDKDYVFDFVTPYPDFDIEALNDYAHSKGIRLVMHHETSSSPRNYERHLEAAYSLMNKYGYDAVKSGYVGDILPQGLHHYSQWMVNHYLYCVTEAAKHHIMVNAHEAVRPTGLCRTYPNLIGNESAMGTEYQAFGGIAPGHTAILPFTRLNGGPMDYTPGIFEQNLKQWCGSDSWVASTICGQLALYVTMYSPLQMAADIPEHYRPHMDAFKFIEDVAVDWEKSVYIAAEPADYIIVARKPRQSSLTGSAAAFSKGEDTWFVGGVTDETERDFELAFDFLDPDCEYEATVYQDAPDAYCYINPKAYTISTITVKSDSVIPVHMGPGGGFAISIKKCR